MKVKGDAYTIEVRKRKKSDPHYRGYGEDYGAQIKWPCGDHMQTVGFNCPSEEDALEKAKWMADKYPTCIVNPCKKDK